MATTSVRCARCGEGNERFASNCVMCGSLMSSKATPHKTIPVHSDGLSDEDHKALLDYAQVAQLSPAVVSKNSRSHSGSTPPQYLAPPPQIRVTERPFALKAMQASGMAAFVMGIVLGLANIFSILPVASFLAFFFMLLGGALWFSSTHIDQ